jgi:hypothetical protein
MVNAVRFAAQFSVSASNTHLEDIDRILKEEAVRRNINIAIEPHDGRSYVYTGPDADSFELALKNRPDIHTVDGFDKYWQSDYHKHTLAAEENRFTSDDFEATHKNFKLLEGRPLFDIETLQRFH